VAAPPPAPNFGHVLGVSYQWRSDENGYNEETSRVVYILEFIPKAEMYVSEEINVEKVLRQGCSISPTLFKIFVHTEFVK
jgi:hypothetical protein